MESIYWVVSRDCNQKCPHCYNDSQPGAPGLSIEQIDRVIEHLPQQHQFEVERIIISGGEILVWPELLFHALERLQQRSDRTSVWVQTNGDLLDEPMLERLLAAGVRRVDVASMDKFHRKGTIQRQELLQRLFESHGMSDAQRDTSSTDQSSPGNQNEPPIGAGEKQLSYAFWGANQDEWIGPLWPRGRAFAKGLSQASPEDDFCRHWSGAKDFLNYDSVGSEVSIQLADVYPCCPMTCRPIGSLLDESLFDMLNRCRQHPVYQALNEGRPEAMGESLGISEEHGTERSRVLGNHCLWCDEFFVKHAPELLYQNGQTTRGAVDLIQLSGRRET